GPRPCLCPDGLPHPVRSATAPRLVRADGLAAPAADHPGARPPALRRAGRLGGRAVRLDLPRGPGRRPAAPPPRHLADPARVARPDPADSPIRLLPELRAYAGTRPPGTPIFNDMLFGGFLIYFTPDLKVFVDDRCELYGDRWLGEYADAYYHHPERIERWAQE